MHRQKRQEFADNYEKYKDKVFSFFMYRTGFNRTLSEDLTSEVFMKALKAYGNYDDTGSFQAWIYRIAKNHLCNYYRKLSPDTGLDDQDALGCEGWEDGADALLAKMERQDALKAIEELGHYQREVIMLRFVEGWSNAEIATFLDKDEGAIRTQISRARKTFRNLVKQYGYENS